MKIEYPKDEKINVQAKDTKMGKTYYCPESKIYFLRLRAKNEFLCLNGFLCAGTTKVLSGNHSLEVVNGTLTFVINEE